LSPTHQFSSDNLTFYQVSLTTFRFSHTHTPYLVTTNHLCCPTPLGHLLLISIDSPGVFSAPHHSTTTPDDFKVNFHAHSHVGTCFGANNPPVPSTVDFPGDFWCTTLPLPTSSSISIDLLFTHSWGAVKNPVCLGCNIPIWLLVDFCQHFCSPRLRSH